MLEHSLEGNIQSGLKFFIFYFLILDKFVLKTWISRQVSYFVGILSEIGNIFLVVLKFFFLLSVRFKSISKSYKSSVQRGKSSYK